MAVFHVIFIFGLLYFVLVSSYEENQLHYECDPDGIIYVKNPDPAFYVWARANASDVICDTTVGMDPTTITILNCFDRVLTLLLSNENKMPTIIKDIHKSYTLSCIAIPEEGIVKKIVDGSHVTVRAPTAASPKPVYPQIPLVSTVVDPETGEAKISAVIGEPFDWVIRGPAGYKIKPLDCTSSGGDNSIFSLDTHTAGCTLDGTLMSDFKFVDETQTSVVSTVHTFRFPDSDILKLSCNMLACLNTTDTCDFNCTNQRRKRQNEEPMINTASQDNHAHNFLATTAHQPALSKRRRKRDSNKRGTVGASIIVIGEPNIFVPGLRRGSSPSSGFSYGTLLLPISLTSIYLYMFRRPTGHVFLLCLT